MKIRVSDYIANYIESMGIKSAFMLSGGGMMHLIDALGQLTQVKYYCNHHEQASAMAAEGYARQTNQLGVCYATSGPGATNIVTGLTGAWLDSAPVLFITGQSNLLQTVRGTQISGLRQYGTFEVDIVAITEPITKYSVFVTDPKSIRFHLEKAVFLATTGRPGPVLIDIPLNIQGALIDTEELEGYTPELENNYKVNAQEIEDVIELLKKAERPILLAGHGIRAAGCINDFRDFVHKLNIPVVTTQLGKDVLPYVSDLFVGHPGVKGDRAGNLCVQNADLILVLGSSLHAQTTGYDVEHFAPHAIKIQIELDKAVLERENVGVNIKINSDIKTFIELMNKHEKLSLNIDGWKDACINWKTKYAVFNEPHIIDDGPVNFYEFAEVLSNELVGNETIVTDAGSAFYVMGQGLKIKENQRYIVSGGLGAMGYALPASLGIATADSDLNVICVTGDGSLQTNIQELQTMKHYQLNVKLFVLNNDGYVSIRNTQNAYFSGHYVGTSIDSGVSIPDLDKIANAYGIPYIACENRYGLKDAINQALAIEGPVICGITSQPNQLIIPTVSSAKLDDGRMVSKPIHDMFPFLDPEELKKNMFASS
ncbi:acetolactate synthase-1/2/3 large subunit [Paenibacillus algorifonticola]|uniref:Acetolactate synthase-1/2/3 large subunit n=1 Tax=Paenibacillus algorifonticola TaxID=684063 RepID=A0A1I2DZI2_9BACL|nr:thiamine pyrophosphate-binding protein [Paenibacillus algorifonticola]SFE86102.1 acetolactate synthase-1/2/3 large subunit [Paenibacillus algorifonticola]